MKPLRRFAILVVAAAVAALPFLAFAQDAAVDAPIAYGDALTELIKLAGTFKGASAIAIAAGVVQIGMLALRTPLADKLGKWKLTALLGLSCVASLLAAKVAGASWGAALASGPLLAGAQNFIHQIVSHFTEKPDAAKA